MLFPRLCFRQELFQAQSLPSECRCRKTDQCRQNRAQTLGTITAQYFPQTSDLDYFTLLLNQAILVMDVAFSGEKCVFLHLHSFGAGVQEKSFIAAVDYAQGVCDQMQKSQRIAIENSGRRAQLISTVIAAPFIFCPTARFRREARKGRRNLKPTLKC